MTIDEAKKKIGARVSYTPFAKDEIYITKQGVIKDVTVQNVLVKFDADWYTTIVDPKDLKLV